MVEETKVIPWITILTKSMKATLPHVQLVGLLGLMNDTKINKERPSRDVVDLIQLVTENVIGVKTNQDQDMKRWSERSCIKDPSYTIPAKDDNCRSLLFTLVILQALIIKSEITAATQ